MSIKSIKKAVKKVVSKKKPVAKVEEVVVKIETVGKTEMVCSGCEDLLKSIRKFVSGCDSHVTKEEVQGAFKRYL